MKQLKASEILLRIGWLSTLPKHVQTSLLDVSEVRSFPEKTLLYGLEYPPGGLYGISEGFVDVLAAPGPFQMRLVHVAGAGWWTGEAAVVSRSGRRAELRTRTNVTAIYIGATSIEALSKRDPTTWRQIAALTVRHLDLTMLYAASFASTDLMLRLLMALMRTIGPGIELGGTFKLPLGQADLAELTGLSRNTVSRLLAKLSEKGCVDRHYASLTVNASRLKELVHARL
jgi:CRP/FNR family cyclic AMP-dependent transcriptional regulator